MTWPRLGPDLANPRARNGLPAMGGGAAEVASGRGALACAPGTLAAVWLWLRASPGRQPSASGRREWIPSRVDRRGGNAGGAQGVSRGVERRGCGKAESCHPPGTVTLRLTAALPEA